MILKSICFSSQSNQHPICSFCLAARRLYNTMQYANKNTTDYLVGLLYAYKVNEDFNGILITRFVQEHGINILFPLHNTVFESMR